MQRTWNVGSGQDLGRAVAEIRRLHGLRQRDLAASNAMSRSYVAKIEAGRSSSLLDHVLRLLRRLGATVTVTFEDDDGQT